jgi:hypothetical protein
MLLTYSNPKLNRSLNYGYQSFGLSLAPNTVSGFQVCPKASAGCSAECLFYSGRGRLEKTQEARIRRTRLFFEHRERFLSLLKAEMALAVEVARGNELEPCFRMNVVSDLPWEKFGVLEEFPDVQHYDYTKILNRTVPDNYHLTFSRSEANEKECVEALARGMNVAAVFDKLPPEYLGRPVISGDTHDLRFLDPKGCIIGLTPKGRAKHDRSGFVVRTGL